MMHRGKSLRRKDHTLFKVQCQIIRLFFGIIIIICHGNFPHLKFILYHFIINAHTYTRTNVQIIICRVVVLRVDWIIIFILGSIKPNRTGEKK